MTCRRRAYLGSEIGLLRVKQHCPNISETSVHDEGIPSWMQQRTSE